MTLVPCGITREIKNNLASPQTTPRSHLTPQPQMRYAYPSRRRKIFPCRSAGGDNMIVVKGEVVTGFGHFKRRITDFPEAFRKATGQTLFPGTMNVDVGTPIKIKEERRILGREIDEPFQDLLLERCAINGIPAWRIRPYSLDIKSGLPPGDGGHGDHILEISCAQQIPNATFGSMVEITLFRDDLDRPQS